MHALFLQPLALGLGALGWGCVHAPSTPANHSPVQQAPPETLPPTAPSPRSQSAPPPVPSTAPPAPQTSLQGLPYTRHLWTTEDTAQLDIAVRTFRPRSGNGPTVILAGAIHIGQPAYYTALQQVFDQSAWVLYEGVDLGHTADTSPATPDIPSAKGYEQIAHALGLICQSEGIAYSQSSFSRADLSLDDMLAGLSHAAEQPGPTGKDAAQALHELKDITAVMTGKSNPLDATLATLKSSPTYRPMMRLMLVESAGDGLAPSPTMSKRLLQTLLDERNAKAMQILRAKLAETPRQASITVFYGAAHLPGMEKILREQLGYLPVDNQWLTALIVHPRLEGLTDSQIRVVKQSIQPKTEQN